MSYLEQAHCADMCSCKRALLKRAEDAEHRLEEMREHRSPPSIYELAARQGVHPFIFTTAPLREDEGSADAMLASIFGVVGATAAEED